MLLVWATLQQFKRALGNMKDRVALFHLDDLLISSRILEDGFKKLQIVLQTLSTAGFSLNLPKCKFIRRTIVYLGGEIRFEGNRPSLLKTEEKKNSPIPENVKQFRQIISLASYFKSFQILMRKRLVSLVIYINRIVRKCACHCIQWVILKQHTGKYAGKMFPIEKVPIPFHTVHVDVVRPLVSYNKKKIIHSCLCR